MGSLFISPGQLVASFTEGNNVTSTPVAIDPFLSLTYNPFFLDPSVPSLSATVSLAGSIRAEDVLSFVNDGSTMGDITGSYDSSTGILTLTSLNTPESNATVDQWNAALQAVTYTDTSDRPDTAQRFVNFIVTDTLGSSTSSTHFIHVASVNDAPIITTSSGSTTFIEAADAASTPVRIDPLLTVTDLDNTTLQRAFISINAAANGDALAFVNDNATMGNITVTKNSGSDLELSGTATLAQWQAGLRAVTYTTTSDSPPASRTISFQLVDGDGLAGAVSTHNIAITASNDSPQITTPASISGFENTVVTFSGGTLISLSDPDIGNNPGLVTLSVTHGTLKLASAGGLTFTTGDGIDDASMSFSGRMTDLNKALSGMTFTPDAFNRDEADLSITINDQGFSGSGGAKSTSYTLPINLAPAA